MFVKSCKLLTGLSYLIIFLFVSKSVIMSILNFNNLKNIIFFILIHDNINYLNYFNKCSIIPLGISLDLLP